MVRILSKREKGRHASSCDAMQLMRLGLMMKAGDKGGSSNNKDVEQNHWR